MPATPSDGKRPYHHHCSSSGSLQRQLDNATSGAAHRNGRWLMQLAQRLIEAEALLIPADAGSMQLAQPLIPVGAGLCHWRSGDNGAAAEAIDLKEAATSERRPKRLI